MSNVKACFVNSLKNVEMETWKKPSLLLLYMHRCWPLVMEERKIKEER
jgi:hypothetical protein